MQTIIQVICSNGKSLRDAIANDTRLQDYGIKVKEHHRSQRPNGWAKLHGMESEHQGALNIRWDSTTPVLTCRVVNRATGRPNQILGDFIRYLFARHSGRIRAINIFRNR